MSPLLESLLAQQQTCRREMDWCRHTCRRCDRAKAWQRRNTKGDK